MRIDVDLATNERRDVKPRGAETWRGASQLKRGLGLGTRTRFLDKENPNKSNGFIKVAAAPVTKNELGDRRG